MARSRACHWAPRPVACTPTSPTRPRHLLADMPQGHWHPLSSCQLSKPGHHLFTQTSQAPKAPTITSLSPLSLSKLPDCFEPHAHPGLTVRGQASDHSRDLQSFLPPAQRSPHLLILLGLPPFKSCHAGPVPGHLLTMLCSGYSGLVVVHKHTGQTPAPGTLCLLHPLIRTPPAYRANQASLRPV